MRGGTCHEKKLMVLSENLCFFCDKGLHPRKKKCLLPYPIHHLQRILGLSTTFPLHIALCDVNGRGNGVSVSDSSSNGGNTDGGGKEDSGHDSDGGGHRQQSTKSGSGRNCGNRDDVDDSNDKGGSDGGGILEGLSAFVGGGRTAMEVPVLEYGGSNAHKGWVVVEHQKLGARCKLCPKNFQSV